MSDVPTGRMIRLYCDGELPPDEAANVEARLREQSELHNGVDFERKLRERVETVLRAEAGPPTGLAERVRRSLEGTGPVIETTHRAWWQSPLRANFFAVAACLALVAGAVLFGIFGPPIDSWPQRGITDISAEVAAAVAGEHVTSTRDVTGLEQRLVSTPEQAWAELAPLIGNGCFDISDLGYEFLGGNDCAVPHCGKGCHLFYKRSGKRPGLVSLHIVPDRGQLPVRGDGIPQRLPLPTDMIPEAEGCQKDVLVWTHDKKTYLLVVCLAEDVEPVARRLQEALLARQGAGP